MSYNTKNYVEQGGDRLVIGGSMEFKEGSGITGFPSDAAFFVLDLQGVDVSGIMEEALDVTALFPLETFQQAVMGAKPVLFRNAALNGCHYTIFSTAADGIDTIVGMGGMVRRADARLFTIVSIELYRDEDRILLRGSTNSDDGEEMIEAAVERDASAYEDVENKK